MNRPDSRALLIISRPDFFEKCVVPFIKENSNNLQDPIDASAKSQIEKLFQGEEIVFDYELHPNRRPKILMQTGKMIFFSKSFSMIITTLGSQIINSQFLHVRKNYQIWVDSEKSDSTKQWPWNFPIKLKKSFEEHFLSCYYILKDLKVGFSLKTHLLSTESLEINKFLRHWKFHLSNACLRMRLVLSKARLWFGTFALRQGWPRERIWNQLLIQKFSKFMVTTC